MMKIYKITIVDSKEDDLRFREAVGNDLADRFYALKKMNRIKGPDSDVYKWTKDKEGLESLLNSLESSKSVNQQKKEDKVNGAKKVYEDDDWVEYEISTYDAMKQYGKGTKWCVAGNYPGDEHKGEQLFDEHLANCYDSYTVVINKHDPSDKYCRCKLINRDVYETWAANDTIVDDPRIHEKQNNLTLIRKALREYGYHVEYSDVNEPFGIDMYIGEAYIASIAEKTDDTFLIYCDDHENSTLNEVMTLDDILNKPEHFKNTYDMNDNHLRQMFRLNGFKTFKRNNKSRVCFVEDDYAFAATAIWHIYRIIDHKNHTVYDADFNHTYDIMHSIKEKLQNL